MSTGFIFVLNINKILIFKDTNWPLDKNGNEVGTKRVVLMLIHQDF